MVLAVVGQNALTLSRGWWVRGPIWRRWSGGTATTRAEGVVEGVAGEEEAEVEEARVSDAGGKPGSAVQYQRQLPKFLQAHAHLLSRRGLRRSPTSVGR